MRATYNLHTYVFKYKLHKPQTQTTFNVKSAVYYYMYVHQVVDDLWNKKILRTICNVFMLLSRSQFAEAAFPSTRALKLDRHVVFELMTCRVGFHFLVKS